MTIVPASPKDRIALNADGTLSGRARGVPFAKDARHIAVLAQGPTGLSIALVDAADVSREALEVAATNLAEHGAQDRMAKTPHAPATARSRDAASSRSPALTSAPCQASSLAGVESGRRVIARTLWPFASSSRAIAPPCRPVAPVTRMRSFPVFIRCSSSWNSRCRRRGASVSVPLCPVVDHAGDREAGEAAALEEGAGIRP